MQHEECLGRGEIRHKKATYKLTTQGTVGRPAALRGYGHFSEMQSSGPAAKLSNQNLHFFSFIEV